MNVIDIRELKRIIRLVESSGIEELEIEQEGVRVRVRKGSGVTQTILADRFLPPPAGYPADFPRSYAASAAAQDAASTGREGVVVPEDEAAQNASLIKSPMVGTFYRSPTPDAPPFIQVGSIVQPDTIVCILEAMKVMNEIKAGLHGKVTEILAENASPVEFGQPLFRLGPV
ncbi:MAG: acetyl-CoA carboxylase biotin carboxyl carrier protein [Candidatus Omnitrophica bacterium COP1]|nr:acetyl-CoA carboxylase biotin carboxyl carrier protein [Candidatus Omnitrophica bacterium COP1]